MNDELKELSTSLSDEDDAVREEAAQRLAQLENPGAAALLVHALEDEIEGVRMWGAYGLGMLRSKDQAVALKKALTQDASPLVQLWSAFGLADLRDTDAAGKLLAFLDHEDPDVRSNAADALTSLRSGAEVVRPALEKKLTAPSERQRAWASAILHRMKHPKALEVWRSALLSPESRLDAALAAPHLKEPAAARDLLRLLAELAEEDLDTPLESMGNLSTAEILSLPLMDLGLGELLTSSDKDSALRADFLMFLSRNTTADPDVLDKIQEHFSKKNPEELGKEIAGILMEHDSSERTVLLAKISECLPKVVIPALKTLGQAECGQIIAEVVKGSEAGDDSSFLYFPLVDVLREGPFADKVAHLPQLDSEDDLEPGLEGENADEVNEMTPVIQRLAAGEEVTGEERTRAEAFLETMGCTADEYLESFALVEEE
jgi:hypothetical protein